MIKPTPPTPVQSCHDLSMTGNLSTKNEAASSKLDSRKAEAVAFWDAQVAPLLSELETTSSDDVAHLCQVCEVLWTTLAQQSLLGKLLSYHAITSSNSSISDTFTCSSSNLIYCIHLFICCKCSKMSCHNVY